jgi:hypothetical protein
LFQTFNDFSSQERLIAWYGIARCISHIQEVFGLAVRDTLRDETPGSEQFFTPSIFGVL